MTLLEITEKNNKYHDKEGTMEKLQKEIAAFIQQRNWKQYHTPKNLAMALSVETAELLEIFQWMTPEESSNADSPTLAHIEEEIGDVMIYLTTLAACFELNVLECARKKLVKNNRKYPPTEPHPDFHKL